jgi:hypothetical protein
VSYTALVANGGTAPTYNWSVNTLSVSLLNNYNYVPGNGDVITLTATSNELCATPATVSTSLVMTVNPNVLPTVSITSALGDTICRGTMDNFSATSTFGGTPTYTWIVNGGTPIGTGSAISYIPAQGDIIECEMTSNYACRTANSVFSAPITMAVDTAISPVVVITANPGTQIAPGQADTLTATVPNAIGSFATLSYQWLINGNPVPAANHPMFINSNYADGDSVTVEVTASSMCGTLSTFNSVIIHLSSTGVTTVKGAGASITLLPNPNNGAFTVKGTLGNSTDEEVTIEITDVLGQVIYKSKVMSHGGVLDEQIHMSNVANGMYVLSVKTATENKVFHVVIEQ